MVMKRENTEIKIYNELLGKKFTTFKINQWDDLNKIEFESLNNLFQHFTSLMLSKGLNENQEFNELGKQLDYINGRINLALISAQKR
jgi:protein tyrosine phosphatase